jgi:hypothetical protein
VTARATIRRLARALAPELATLERDQRDAVNALALHLLSRFAQDAHEPFDPDGRTFLPTGYMQRRLRETGARKSGEKAARGALRFLVASGILEDTREIKRPRRRPQRMAAREKFAPPAAQEIDGGRDAQLSFQLSFQRSYWRRVFRVVPLAKVLRVKAAMQGAYGHFEEVPQHLASLSAWAVRQGLISRPKRRRNARPGSVQ